jgi:hypothetical protein
VRLRKSIELLKLIDSTGVSAGQAAGRGSMLIATGLLLLVLCTVLWARDTPIGKSLRVVLIDAPAKILIRTTPLKMALGLVVFLVLIVFIFGAPELVALMGLSDLYFYLDFTIVAMLINTAVRLKSVLACSIRLLRRRAPREIPQWKRAGSRNRLSRPRRPKSLPSADEGGPEWGWAFA